MNNKFTTDTIGSAALCRLLEIRLGAIFSNKTVYRYLVIDGCGPELQILNCIDSPQALPHVKLAFTIWATMDVEDRHKVLSTFQRLYAAMPDADQGNRRMLVFCALFINEFATTLAEAMEWPE